MGYIQFLTVLHAYTRIKAYTPSVRSEMPETKLLGHLISCAVRFTDQFGAR